MKDKRSMKDKPSPPMRELENADPHELSSPVPRLFLVVVVALLAWAVVYMIRQAPAMDSSSVGQQPEPMDANKATAGPR